MDQHAAVVSWHAQKATVLADLAGKDPHSAWTAFYPGTERATMGSLVPFRSVPQGRTGSRHAVKTPTLTLQIRGWLLVSQ